MEDIKVPIGVRRDEKRRREVQRVRRERRKEIDLIQVEMSLMSLLMKKQIKLQFRNDRLKVLDLTPYL